MPIDAARVAGMTFDEDTLLVQRFLGGDASAFDRIFDKYKDRVYVVAQGVLLNPDEAQDAVQDAFALIYRNLPRFRRQSSLSTWIFRVAVNTAIQHARKLNHRKRQLPLSAASDQEAPILDGGADAAHVHQALSQLRPDDRAVLTLFYWEDLSLAQMAEALGCSANAVKTRVYRARERFREAYTGLGGSEDG